MIRIMLLLLLMVNNFSYSIVLAQSVYKIYGETSKVVDCYFFFYMIRCGYAGLNIKYIYTKIIPDYKSENLSSSYRFSVKEYKINLPDGTYYYYDTKDSTKRKLDKKYLIFKGTFKDSLAQGRFELFHRDNKTSKINQKLILHFNKGLKEGPFYYYEYEIYDWLIFNWRVLSVYEEGYFKGDKLDGIILKYVNSSRKSNKKLKLNEISMYEGGVLKSWVLLKEPYNRWNPENEPKVFYSIRQDLCEQCTKKYEKMEPNSDYSELCIEQLYNEMRGKYQERYNFIRVKKRLLRERKLMKNKKEDEK